MRFEVPQFIEIEDKIVGPLTWRQFVYVAGGVGIITILYLNTSFMITVLLGLPIGALSASLAFHKVNNRPFSIFLEALVSYTAKKKLYLWRKETASSVIEKDYEAVSPTPKLSNTYGQTITSLSHKLEHHLPE